VEFKLQASLGYLFNYMAMFLIVVVALYIVFQLTASSAKVLLPSKCTFDQGINCQGVIVASNSVATKIALLGTNMLSYPIANVILTVNASGQKTSGACTPNLVVPGGTLLCVLNAPVYTPTTSNYAATLIVNASYCGLAGANCANAVKEHYLGNDTTSVEKLISPNVNLSITPSKTTAGLNGTIQLTVKLNVFGYSLNVQNPQISSSNPSVTISPSTTQSGTYFSSSSGNSCSSQINVSFVGMKTNTTITFTAPPAVFSQTFFVTNQNSNNVTVINGTTAAESTLSSGISSPYSVAFNPSQTYAYVTEPAQNKVVILNTTKYSSAKFGTVVNSISISMPETIAIGNNNQMAYIPQYIYGNVAVWNIANINNNYFVKNISVGGIQIQPVFVTLSGDNSKLFVADKAALNIKEINTSTNAVLATVSLPSSPSAIASSSNGGTIYVTLPSSSTFDVIQPLGNPQIVKTVSLGSAPTGIALSPDGSKLYITDTSLNKLYVYNPTTYTQITNTSTGSNPVFVTATNSSVYVVNQNSKILSIINTTSFKVVANYSIGSGATWVGIKTK
jgi:YVTN family beta-propeller protein